MKKQNEIKNNKIQLVNISASDIKLIANIIHNENSINELKRVTGNKVLGLQIISSMFIVGMLIVNHWLLSTFCFISSMIFLYLSNKMDKLYWNIGEHIK